MTYWLGLSGTIPHIIGALQQIGYDPESILKHLYIVIKNEVSALQVRQIFLFVSSLSIIWVYIAEIIWKRSVVEALLVAALLGFSWEIAYHARWIAPDAILMQFGALTLLLVICSIRCKSNIRWFFLVTASIVAGFGMGTKYPGGLLLLPVLIALLINDGRRDNLLSTGLKAAGLVFIFLISYLFTTPGTVLDPINFIDDFVFEINHYQAGHYGQTVNRGLIHLWLMFRYFAEVFFFSLSTIIRIFIPVCNSWNLCVIKRKLPGGSINTQLSPGLYIVLQFSKCDDCSQFTCRCSVLSNFSRQRSHCRLVMD
jgi:4-amino-4-deoxy-L-arabinose transferase-like glycosyltransferase